MYENYSNQSLPPKEYRELLGTAMCVFNSNNQFIIENILRIDRENFNWHELIDKTSGQLLARIKETIEEETNNTDITRMFESLIQQRNRIIHSFQITKDNEQILCTKDKQHNQLIITTDYLSTFIKENSKLSDMLHKLRGY
ncbi:MAG: hypothetical protein KGV46_00135 [Pasteurella sp.]|nr:hypothetical protein [Pasteurella sp.]